MNTREQFGNYLLLKKLTEDALGETFRAGLSGENGAKKVVLLRVFNGQGIDGARLWSTCADRKQIQQILQNPNIGEPVDMGEVQGIPYVAYEYISGKNMAQLLEQAARKRNYIPPEHALLITERVALALAAACESRLGGDRILHGFMIPQLAIISNEGETRLTGFEYSPGLRGFASNPIIRQHFGRYLAPEVHQGEAPHRADDIYSLGVILFELLTGRPLPPPAADGYVSIIDQGLLATEGTPIPAELNQLLKQSLVARDQRIGDPVKWQKELNRLIFDGGFNPTTFNLAFFMHNLFRQEIERESQEIEVEKTLPLPVVKAAEPPPPPVAAGTDPGTGTGVGTGTGTGAVPVPPPAPVADPSGTGTGIREPTGNFVPEYAREEKSSVPWIPILAVLAVIAVGITGYLGWTTMQQQQQQQQQAELPPPPPPPPVEPVEEEPAGPSPEEIKAQIADLVAARTSEMEDRVRKQYTDQMAELEKQLEESKKAAEKRRLERELAEAQAEEEAAKKAEEEAKQAKLAEKPPEKPAEEPAAETAEMKTESSVLQATAKPPAAKPAPPPTKPKVPEVKRGDLVKPGAGVVPPKPVRVSPRFPEVARRLGKRDADVTVKVLVDENGKPLEVERVGDKVGFGFDAEAIKAAKTASYKPATKNGIPVKMWLEMTVQFRP